MNEKVSRASNEVGIEPQFQTIDGLSIRFASSERAAAERQEALLLCPWPESIYAFEPTWAQLSKHARLVAVDLPGFGHSERRDSLMSPRAMGEFIIKIADAFELRNPHVVGPDVGTAASLFAAALYPKRLRSLVVGTGGAAVPMQLGGVLKEWVEAPDLEPYRRVDGRLIVDAAIGTLERYVPSEIAAEDYRSGYAGARFVESMKYVRAYPDELPILRDMLPDIQTPVHIISGKHDTVVPPVNAEFLHERLPNSKLSFIDAGHFIWEDAAAEYAALVENWWAGGYEAGSKNFKVHVG